MYNMFPAREDFAKFSRVIFLFFRKWFFVSRIMTVIYNNVI